MKGPKKFFISLTSAVLSFALLSVSAMAYTGPATVKVGTTLNVRQSAYTGATVLARISNGTSLTVTSTSGSLYKVSYSGGSGWVSANYVLLSSSNGAQTVTNTAKSMLGVPYVFAGASTTGVDCSGLTLYAYAKAGVTLPHSAAQQVNYGVTVARASLSSGDLVFFDTDGGNNNITHVGIYIGSGNVIEAQTGSVQKVATISLSNSYWSGAYMTARRIFG